MIFLGIDNFIRPNQNTWGTASDGQTWAIVRSAMNWQIANNQGACNGAASFTIFRLGSLTPTNPDIQVRVIPADGANNGCVARFQNSNNFYYGVLAGGTTMLIGRDLAGSFSTLISTPFPYSFGTAYHLRFRLIGSLLLLKAWADGSPEPSNFQLNFTDLNFLSGGFGLGSDSSVASSTLFDQFIVTDALGAFMANLGGTVTLVDANGHQITSALTPLAENGQPNPLLTTATIANTGASPIPVHQSTNNAVVPAGAATTVIKASPGDLVSVTLTGAVPTAITQIFDNPAAGSGNVLLVIPTTATVGQIFLLNGFAKTGITALGIAGSAQLMVYFN